jgi:hypothetical protein
VDFYLVGSSSNKIPSRSFSKIQKSSVGSALLVCPRDKDPNFPKDFAHLPSDHLEDVNVGEEKIITSVPTFCILPFGTEPVYGEFGDPETRRFFEKLGPEFANWHRLMSIALSSHQETMKVRLSLATSDEEASFIPRFSEIEIPNNAPYGILMPVVPEALQDGSDIKEKIDGLLAVFDPSPSPSNFGTPNNTAVSGLTTQTTGTSAGSTSTQSTASLQQGFQITKAMVNAVKLLTHPESENKKKDDALSIAKLKCFMAMANIDWATGTIIGDLIEPTMTPGLDKCFDYSTAATRSSQFQADIETSMEKPPKSDIEGRLNSINQESSFFYAPVASCHQFLKGNLERFPISTFHKE